MFEQKYYIVIFNNEFFKVTSRSYPIEIFITHIEVSYHIFYAIDILGFWNQYTFDMMTQEWPEIYKILKE